MSQKIVTRDEIVSLVKEAKAKTKGLLVGYTSGVFDLMHPGHVQYLEDAKKHCDLLIVGVNSDASVKKYKSAVRPIVPAEARMKVLAGLTSVDLIFQFDEVNNNHNIEFIKPDIYLKAGD